MSAAPDPPAAVPRPGPTFGLLLDWAEGRLAPDVAARVAREVAAAGAAVAADVAWIARFLVDARAAALARPPESVRRAVRALYRERFGAEDSGVGA